MAKPGGMEYVRSRYGVPAKRGMKVIYDDGRHRYEGRIMSASNGKLHVMTINGMIWLHPTDHVKYLTVV